MSTSVATSMALAALCGAEAWPPQQLTETFSRSLFASSAPVFEKKLPA